MKPEDIEDFTEENENEEIEQTNTDSQENGEQSDSTTHSEYKIPGREKAAYPIICRGCIRIGFGLRFVRDPGTCSAAYQ